jgi:hypothetical protein
MPEYRALTALVPRIAAGTLLILIVGTFATNNNATGSVNKLLYVCVLALGFGITALYLHGHRSTQLDAAVAVLASCGLLWGIWTIERPQLLASGYWEGFGYHVAVAVLILLVLFGTLLQSRRFSMPIRIVLGLAVAACCLCDLLAAVRTIDYMPYVNNNLNEINDLLGPAAGKVPESTYIPQYSVLYGWLFLPLKPFLSPTALVATMSVFFTTLGLGTVFLAVLIVKRVLGTKGYLLATALVVPITYVTSHQMGDISSIASLFQELPIRILSGLFIIAIGLTDLVLVYRGTVRAGHLFLIGIACGIIAWNSQDFGLAAAGVYGLMILCGAMPSVRSRAAGMWLGGFIVGVASYPLFLLAMGSPMNFGFVAAFVKLFGSGLGSAPIQVPGPVLVVMPVIVCSTAAGWALMRGRRRGVPSGNGLLDQATVTLTFVGTWSALCLVYYVNRAYAAGELQTMLLPCAVCIGALLSIAIHSDQARALWHRGGLLSRARISGEMKFIPVGMLVGLCFASALLTPNPVLAAKSLRHPPAQSGYTDYDLPAVLSAVRIAQRYTAGKPGGLTYLGESFNYVSLETRVPSNAVLFPFPLSAIGVVTEIDCRYLQHHHSKWMVLSLDGLAAFGSHACGMYQAVDLPGVSRGQLQELKR